MPAVRQGDKIMVISMLIGAAAWGGVAGLVGAAGVGGARGRLWGASTSGPPMIVRISKHSEIFVI